MTDPGISVVIPAFNEAQRLPRTLDDLVHDLRSSGGPWEIVVADDGSTDGTSDVVTERARTEPRLRLVRAEVNRGKGDALRSGVDAAHHDVVVLLDADLPVPFPVVRALAGQVASADLVLGSRTIAGARIVRPQPLSRQVGGSVFRLVVRALGFTGASDPQCGAKALRRSTVGPILGRVTGTGFSFDVELIERSRRGGLRVVEHPVEWRHVDGSSLHPVRDAARTLRELATLRKELHSDRASGVPAPPPVEARPRAAR